jgi:hypothetical protein
MEAKEKAIELVGKFSPLMTTWDCYNDEPRFNEDIIADAKQCALILVNELLGYMGADRGTEFWLQVKSEIENL